MIDVGLLVFFSGLNEVLIVDFMVKSSKSKFIVSVSIEMMMMAMGLSVSFALFLAPRSLERAEL